MLEKIFRGKSWAQIVWAMEGKGAAVGYGVTYRNGPLHSKNPSLNMVNGTSSGCTSLAFLPSFTTCAKEQEANGMSGSRCLHPENRRTSTFAFPSPARALSSLILSSNNFMSSGRVPRPELVGAAEVP